MHVIALQFGLFKQFCASLNFLLTFLQLYHILWYDCSFLYRELFAENLNVLLERKFPRENSHFTLLKRHSLHSHKFIQFTDTTFSFLNCYHSLNNRCEAELSSTLIFPLSETLTSQLIILTFKDLFCLGLMNFLWREGPALFFLWPHNKFSAARVQGHHVTKGSFLHTWVIIISS